MLKTHDGFSQHEMKLVQLDAADASSDAALDGWLRATVPTKASISPRPSPNPNPNPRPSPYPNPNPRPSPNPNPNPNPGPNPTANP